MKYPLTFIFVLLLFSTSAMAQNSYELLEKSTMKITGTSTIHDWECEVQEINADVRINPQSQKEKITSNPVESLTLTIPVEKIESGKGGMNKKIYRALEHEDHPMISFTLDSATLANGSAGSGFTLNVSGDLAIAGQTQLIQFPVEGVMQPDGTMQFTGNYTLNMKDYGVDPPSAMLGTIRSGEEVTIYFELFFGNS